MSCVINFYMKLFNNPVMYKVIKDNKHRQILSLCVSLNSYTHDIEAVSCDEMFVDLTELLADTGATPLEFASLIRKEIKQATKCNASAGLGMEKESICCEAFMIRIFEKF